MAALAVVAVVDKRHLLLALAQILAQGKTATKGMPDQGQSTLRIRREQLDIELNPSKRGYFNDPSHYTHAPANDFNGELLFLW
ncbi:hypothetical protein BC827DRAFT_1209062 [Russula dissimulans]|nr:hypothetical protein BC827DRAFT_1209062 [Russula dissimulans]